MITFARKNDWRMPGHQPYGCQTCLLTIYLPFFHHVLTSIIPLISHYSALVKLVLPGVSSRTIIFIYRSIRKYCLLLFLSHHRIGQGQKRPQDSSFPTNFPPYCLDFEASVLIVVAGWTDVDVTKKRRMRLKTFGHYLYLP